MMKILYALLCALILSQPALADEKSDVESMLKAKVDAVIAVLQNKTLEQHEKIKITTEIVEPMFDFPLMAKLALGKKHWYAAPKEKQDRFTDLFVKLLKDSYLEKLNLYTDETITFKQPEMVDNRIQIASELVSTNNRISMLYKFYKSEKNWKIYDIEIADVSLIKSYRTQFDSKLNTETIDDLIAEMEKPKNK
jgi:phospholipid transport system substrate-binding protein